MNEIPTAFQLNDETMIARGPDSIVHRFGDVVVKEYIFLDTATLLKYQTATNLLSISLTEEPLVQEAVINGEPWEVQYCAIPILQVIDRKQPLAVSNYVPGPNGFDFLRTERRNAIPAIAELKDTQEAQYLQLFYEQMKGPEFNKKFMDATISTNFLARLKEVTGIKNVKNFARTNAKVRVDVPGKRLHLLVTDFASNIDEVVFPTVL